MGEKERRKEKREEEMRRNTLYLSVIQEGYCILFSLWISNTKCVCEYNQSLFPSNEKKTMIVTHFAISLVCFELVIISINTLNVLLCKIW